MDLTNNIDCGILLLTIKETAFFINNTGCEYGEWKLNRFLNGCQKAPIFYFGDKNMKVKRICKICGKGFYVYPYRVKRGEGKFCSLKCSGKQKSQKIKRICEICGKEFFVIPSTIKRGGGRFCSYKCMGKWESNNRRGKNSYGWKGGRVEQVCKNCGKRFLVKVYRLKLKDRVKFCSVECKKKWKRENPLPEEIREKMSEARKKYFSIKENLEKISGDKSHLWKGGITPIYIMRLSGSKWKVIIKKVYKRDNYQCQLCGKKGGKLNAHHIIPWRVSHNDKMSNLITLCRSCHSKIENKWYQYAPMFFEMNGVYEPLKENSLFELGKG